MSETHEFIGPKDSPILAERFFARWFGPRNIHPLWIIPIVTVIIVLPMFVTYWLAGVFDGLESSQQFWERYFGFWFEIFMSALTGFFIAAAEMLRRGYRSDLVAMAAIVDGGSETTDRLRLDYDRQTVFVRTAIGIVAGIGFALIFGPLVEVRGFHQVITDIVYLRLLLSGYVSAVFIFDGVRSCRLMAAIARSQLKVDLLDIGNLEPSTRTGLRVGSMSFVGAALSVPLLAEESVIFITLNLQLISLAGAAILLLLPVLAVHGAIQTAKMEAVEKAIAPSAKQKRMGKPGPWLTPLPGGNFWMKCRNGRPMR